MAWIYLINSVDNTKLTHYLTSLGNYTTQVHVDENKIKICLITKIIEEKTIASKVLPVTQCHCLSSCCCFIQKWCISNIQPCEVTDHCLKVQQGLQSSLSQFRLVWGIGCGPAGVKIYKTMTYKNLSHGILWAACTKSGVLHFSFPILI